MVYSLSHDPSPATLAQILGYRFTALGIGLTLRTGGEWHAITTADSVASFEFGHGKDMDRLAYNRRSIARALRQRATVLGEHAGFGDLFVPVPHVRDHVLITGPFAMRRPTSSDIAARWRWISGRQGHPADPEFSRYLSLTLATLTLEGGLVQSYRRLVERYASLLSGKGGLDDFREAMALAAAVERARAVEQVWSAAREMIDESRASAWRSPQLGNDRARMGLIGVPDHVLVALVARTDKEVDPVDKLLRQAAFQRACVGLARAERALAGRVGDHGVMILVSGRRTQTQTRHVMRRIYDQLAARARKDFRLSIHAGVSATAGDAPLGERYEQALGAAERALSRGERLVFDEPAVARSSSLVRQLRGELGALAASQPHALVARFERYAEAVSMQAGYRVDLVQAHLEAAFDQAAHALLASGTLGAQDHRDMCRELERAARDAATVDDLVAMYRAAMSDLAFVAEQPVRASRDRSLRRAMVFVQRHFAESLSVRQVARIAGFAPAYFGQLFKEREQTTFQRYLRARRVEHAKQLLASTRLTTERVGQLSGFGERHYFYRAFKLVTGKTPSEVRAGMRKRR